MTPWERVDAHLTANKGKGQSWAWLTRELGLKAAAVGNWKGRDIPAKYHAPIATLLGRSTDWVSGAVSFAEWPFALVDQDRYEKLSPETKGAAQLRMMDAIDRLENKADGVVRDKINEFERMNASPAKSAPRTQSITDQLLAKERRHIDERRRVNVERRKRAL